MNSTVDFYYFSGTGNTKALVDFVVKILKIHNIRTSLSMLDNGYIPGNPANDLWLAFPVNSQAVSPFIWKFFRSLPKSNGTKVYVIATLNDSAHILEPLCTLLKNKGYIPTLACEISMPNNILDSEARPDDDQTRITAAYKKADTFVRKAVAGERGWNSEYAGSKAVSFLSRRTVLPWMSMRLMIRLRTVPTKCVNCELCVLQCPAGNITVVDDLPYHGYKCDFCMKCAANCPRQAIVVSGKNKLHFRNARMHKSTMEQ
jgi:ferredoxin